MIDAISKQINTPVSFRESQHPIAGFSLKNKTQKSSSQLLRQDNAGIHIQYREDDRGNIIEHHTTRSISKYKNSLSSDLTDRRKSNQKNKNKLPIQNSILLANIISSEGTDQISNSRQMQSITKVTKKSFKSSQVLQEQMSLNKKRLKSQRDFTCLDNNFNNLYNTRQKLGNSAQQINKNFQVISSNSQHEYLVGHSRKDKIQKNLEQKTQLKQQNNKFPTRVEYHEEYSIGEKQLHRIEIHQIQHRKLKSQKLQQILIESTLVKPKFSFKAVNSAQLKRTEQHADSSAAIEQIMEENEQSWNRSDQNSSKSASNFATLLRSKQSINLRISNRGQLSGYVINSTQEQEKKLHTKIQALMRCNQLYDMKIHAKQQQIKAIQQIVLNEQHQVSTYQDNMTKAYQNVYEKPESLMLSSLHGPARNNKFEERIKHLQKLDMKFTGISKKVYKQIIYGKSLLLDNQHLQIGFDNRKGKGQIQLYYTFKSSFHKVRAYIEESKACGYTLSEDFDVKMSNVPAGKKIKFKIIIQYTGNKNEDQKFMKLHTVLSKSTHDVLIYDVALPYCLYRNYFVITEQACTQAYMSRFVTNWQLYSDEMCKNPKYFLTTLFHAGQWKDKTEYLINILIKGEEKPLIILLNNGYFAIQVPDRENLDVVSTIGNLLCQLR